MPNTLFYGDNLDILRDKIKDDSVDLCYIDPPFNSKRNYNQIYNNIGTEDKAQAQAFVDTWTWDEHAEAGFQQILSNSGGRFTSQTIDLIKGLHPVLKKGSLLAYLVSMTLRVVEIHRVLKPTGSFYLHCDPTSSHYLKLVLDTIFIPDGGEYQNEIVWRRTTNSGSSKAIAKRYPSNSDIIFFYTKSDKYEFAHARGEYSDKYKSRFTKQDERGYYYSDNLKTYSQERLKALTADNRIEFTSNGKPRIKNYLHEGKGMIFDNIWTDIDSLNSQAAERMGYPTQKPEALLERIIQASTNPGDTVLDAYCGCGTTIAVAQRLGRQWIGMDITYQSIALILRRLEAQFGPETVKAVTLGGIPKDMASAEALALKKDDRTRKEFEKWAVLTFTNNLAVINSKKGADAGIDGIAYTATGPDSTAKIVFQVKSGGVQRKDIATLNSDRQRENAELAFFLTLEPDTKPMRDEAAQIGNLLPPAHAEELPPRADCAGERLRGRRRPPANAPCSRSVKDRANGVHARRPRAVRLHRPQRLTACARARRHG